LISINIHINRKRLLTTSFVVLLSLLSCHSKDTSESSQQLVFNLQSISPLRSFINENFELNKLVKSESPSLIVFIGNQVCVSCVQHEINQLNSLSPCLNNYNLRIVISEDPNSFDSKYQPMVKPNHVSEITQSEIEFYGIAYVILDEYFILDEQTVDGSIPYYHNLSKSNHLKFADFFNCSKG